MLVVARHAGVCPRALLVVSLLLVQGFRCSKKSFIEFKGCWKMAKAGSMREGAVSCVETCDGEMVAALLKDAESWLLANMKLSPDNGQSRELCTGLTAALVWVTHP